ncbi:hypothetical protein MLD38_019178 [Melastoma candidum]|uniref:Uncharacterized protein n=1 Tax=Melastoma candidum TaxID=119954 RepID=A0ACB9R078_9MYRT|nr:hypothetical protein MLD38_019178 [Melastoma candidum]
MASDQPIDTGHWPLTDQLKGAIRCPFAPWGTPSASFWSASHTPNTKFWARTCNKETQPKRLKASSFFHLDLARFAMTSESAEWKCDPEIVSYDEEGSNFEKLWEAHGYIEMVEEIARPGCSPETLTISLASVKDLVDRHLSIPPKR